MESISIDEILHITRGELLQGTQSLAITNVAIDSRKINNNDLYVPIVGETNNGHDYISQACSNGGRVCLTEERERLFPEEMTVIYVASTLAAMKALAGFNRHRYRIPVIAITGSSGKTTTKDLVAAVLSQKFHTLKTDGNFNNEYGIPQTLCNLESDHQIAVIEMGMDHLGDISKSIQLVDPDISVITNVGLSHIERLKTQENIYLAKKEILQTLTSEGIAYINGDDEFLKKIKAENNRYQVKTFGLQGEHTVTAQNYTSRQTGLEIQVAWEDQNEVFTFNYPGEHNVYNCLVAIGLGYFYEMTQSEIQKGLDAFVPSGNRMDIFTVGEIKVINDSYNANPDAMRASLDVLATLGCDYQRKIAILGDMLEMGEYGPAAHLEVGSYARNKADILISVGDLGRSICQGYENAGQVYQVSDALAAGACLKEIVQPGDIILIKASRGMGLERVIDYIKEGGQ
ncbi:UDP-N-acetylmuramoyl-tripeptide--D-alanyl-D-alanine ligase [Acetobacterium sp.]|jgi:UDP-N-acetylmuramoyl-tripeptide--D-alanyl-D-alanine ligase|uniref:UDP-N-acetylmuramoyl-tripeptide--D-alanyl-D- alanine ligase n=1 Tax=Acetobacterium sp. TaxID=1872094 RepID=UPI000CACEB43|nr:UDP-N-acetylmuramoyl-tripeptide--D-alanyl-D-alanine ligase [Acetobacterium sp.]MDO9492094.1 UDP-N-acetylmuramoyl-tripeptide--D-alanyl-D-alanine ligase [Acetobacterium sp.]PKM71117.1 MAG: UDP-N-acetylmuramoyl-tripeptide--D-alanyl-D-alanine ligase [Firmicutes bacterium HGW-Firmicutes-17]